MLLGRRGLHAFPCVGSERGPRLWLYEVTLYMTNERFGGSGLGSLPCRHTGEVRETRGVEKVNTPSFYLTDGHVYLLDHVFPDNYQDIYQLLHNNTNT
jgi:hypothetical protein